MKIIIDSASGCKCTGALPDCETALPALAEALPDVVLMDIKLRPGKMSGIEGVRLIKEKLPETDLKTSNRSALGAKVRLRATINGNAVWQMREISAQNSFNGHNMLNAHFGLGPAAVIDSLKTIWPSGMVDVYAQVAADSFYLATEGESIKTSLRESSRLPVPREFELLQNYPNPFNPVTRIRFRLARPQFVTLKVFDVNGRELATLLDERRPAGSHEIIFDAARLSGSSILFYQLTAGSTRQARKMVLAK